ncbi:MAG TPA: nucleoside triphosphate pyrophosphohydrolase [Chitinophagales bacterium]|nr:nucleoside triphosphate pyrophosphohydrolase [Chitinophagales bacterium]
MDERLKAFERLLDIMDELREKCPWDKAQTIDSLRKLTIEETYELSEAIIDQNDTNIKEELGDILLHIVFYSKIASEDNKFDITDVLNSVCEKLISRHPHIYGDLELNDENEVKENWEKLKLKEGRKSVLEGVPKGLPAMVKAQRVQDKVRQVGFDWERASQVIDKIQEELAEVQEAIDDKDQDEIEMEIGDLLFATINYARLLGVDAEKGLELTNKKFIKRFQFVEQKAAGQGLNISDVPYKQMEEWYQASKENE